MADSAEIIGLDGIYICESTLVILEHRTNKLHSSTIHDRLGWRNGQSQLVYLRCVYHHARCPAVLPLSLPPYLLTSFIRRILEFVAAVAKFVYNIPTALEQYLQDHLQECKFVLFAVLAAITAIAATCALCVLVPAVLKAVVPIGKFVLSTLKIALNSILYPIIWVLKGKSWSQCVASCDEHEHEPTKMKLMNDGNRARNVLCVSFADHAPWGRRRGTGREAE